MMSKGEIVGKVANYQDFPSGPVVGNPSTNAGDRGLISSQGKSYMPRSNWAHELQLLQPTPLEPVLRKWKSHRNRTWASQWGVAPACSNSTKPVCSQQKLSTVENYFLKNVTPEHSVQLLSHVWLFATPWIAARQACLSFTISWSLLKLMSIKSMMSSNHLILCHPLLLLSSIFPSIRVFSNESALRIGW